MARPLAVALAVALFLLALPAGGPTPLPTAEVARAGTIRETTAPPAGRHRQEVTGKPDTDAAPAAVDCEDYAAWVPATADRVRRAYEIGEEIGRLGAELEPEDFIAAMKGFSAEFAVMADDQARSDPPAGVEEANRELATTFADFAYVVGEIAAMLEFSMIALPEGGGIDNATLADFWALLPRLTDYLDLIVAYLAGLAEGCGIEVG